jgi:TonB-linked SusC/RagA family outer membrane protein
MKKKVLRISTFGLPLALLLAGQPSYSQVFALDAPTTKNSGSTTTTVANRKVKDVLNELRVHYKVDMLFSDQMVESYSVPANAVNLNRTLEQNLESVLKPAGLKYKKAKDGSYLITRPSSESRGGGQSIPTSNLNGYSESYSNNQAEITVTGTVTDGQGEAMPGATVMLKGTSSVGTVTDIQGNYRIVVPDGVENPILMFSSIGYVTEETALNGRNVVNVSLLEDIKTLEEIVVVGYGEQKKSLVTGAISSVKGEELATVSSTRVEQALQGRTAGVNVLPASGSPGSGMRVRVRGAGSNGNAEPLYIVDGMRAGGIEYLDPSEIASIEVLKDAASAAIYGAEGANGVVIITTKSGNKNGVSSVEYNNQFGVQSVRNNLMPMMTSEQYAAYMAESGTAMPNGNQFDPAQFRGTPSTNWFNEIFQPAPMQRHSLNFRGGTEKSSYLLGGSVFQQDGIVGGDKSQFNRFTLRLNSDHKIKSWLSVGNRLSYSHFNRNGISEDSEFGSVINSALMMDPTTPAIYTGALPAHAQAALDAGNPLVRDANGNIYGLSPYIYGEVGNPLAMIDITKNRTVQNKIVGNIFADIEPFKGLKITTRFGIDGAFQRNHGWNPPFWWSSERRSSATSVFDTNQDWMTWQWENFATYNKTIGKSNITLLGGMSALQRSYNRLNGTSVGMFKNEDKFAYHDFTSNSNNNLFGIATDNTLASYFGRVGYDYAGKYLFNATVRRDGSSLLPAVNQWGTFPSFSAGWVLSNESFYPAALGNIMNQVKLRASWGQNGSLSNLQVGQWASLISTQNIQYRDAEGNLLVGAEPDAIENPNLKWETSEQIDFGVDLGFFSNRVSVTADYFRKTTRDLITPGTAPLFAGNPLNWDNAGNVLNRGFEFEVSVRNNEGALGYDAGLNFTTLKNEVTYLNPNYERLPGANVGTGWTASWFEQGMPVWYFRGYKTDGIFQNDEQVTEYTSRISGYNPSPGDPIVVDVNDDNNISMEDQTFIGNPHPKLMYGARVNLTYKGFDFLVFAQGQYGNDVLMGFNRADRQTANKPEFFYTNRWTGEGSTNTWFGANTSSSYIYNSDLMIFDGSFMRVRQLQLGYTLPKELLTKMHVKNLRVYVSLDNFFTFTKYPGLDPEAGSNNVRSLGIDRGVYPIPRVALGGLSFSF